MKQKIPIVEYKGKNRQSMFENQFYFKMLTIHLIGMIQGMSLIALIVFQELNYKYIAIVLFLIVMLLTPPIKLFKRK
jgi:hypothetical protein